MYFKLIVIVFVICINGKVTKGSGQEKYVTLKTSKGDITLELFWNKAPKAAFNFNRLVQRRHYDNTIFYRVIQRYLIQGGDPTGTGEGGQSTYGHPFKDEIHADLTFDREGILAMANSGPDTNRTQFFITLGRAPNLNGKHTIFGKVIKGMDVVRAIGNVRVDRNNRPLKQVQLLSATVHD